ncbi:hypothetical protein BELL_0386g00070 [Botrytis elliptica]|uniref:non-specific serine/threonine protein kinase n=1 Tax=Botrytis elliptica TaxID=278938 RepID=A0A4Z1JI12_9HELO|nr:hypothetical protein EAE99_000465 [Botrytis elliptica]TGO73146.1 hypothetical protein BELL_0386g00070 [Botrytis elliptica]
MAEENVYDPDLEQDLEFYEGPDPAEHVGMPADIKAPRDPLALHDIGWRRRRKRWLDKVWTWNEPLNPMYEGVKILSSQGDCLVGLWRAETQFGQKNIIVKQRPRSWRDLKDPMGQKLSEESKHYENLQSLLPPGHNHHIVKLFKKAWVDEGKNYLSQDVGQVERMILEYCNGSLDDLISWHIRHHTMVSERSSWEIFHCLARSLLIMKHGTENPADYSRQYDPMGNDLNIVHFDLNPQNIYIKNFPHPTHSRDRGYVPGSFRRAAKIKIPQNEEYHRKHCNLGNINSRAPEQLRGRDMRDTRPWLQSRVIYHKAGQDNTLQSVVYTSKTNVWQVGLIMFCILHCRTSVNWNDLEARRSHGTPRLVYGGPTIMTKTHQWQRVSKDLELPYSRSLLYAIYECLLIEPSNRPDVATLFETTRAGLAQANIEAGLLPPDLAAAQPAAQPEPELAPDAPLAPQQVPLPAAPPEQIRPPAIPRVAPVVENPELDLDPGPPEPRLGPAPAPLQPPHDPPAPNQQAAEPAPPQQEPPDRPNVIQAEIPDPRAVVYAEADEHLPAYQLEAPEGEAMLQPEWGAGLERPAPNYPEPPVYEDYIQAPAEPQPHPDPDIPQPRNQFPPRLPAAAPRAPLLPPAPRQMQPPLLNLPRGLQLGPDNPVLIAVIPPEYLPSILICHVIENDLFHRQIGNIYLQNLRPNTSFYEIKYMLVAEGLGIERMNIRIRVDDGGAQRELADWERRRTLGDGVAVLVDDPNGLVFREGGWEPL